VPWPPLLGLPPELVPPLREDDEPLGAGAGVWPEAVSWAISFSWTLPMAVVIWWYLAEESWPVALAASTRAESP
jgi:hypothetical protein